MVPRRIWGPTAWQPLRDLRDTGRDVVQTVHLCQHVPTAETWIYEDCFGDWGGGTLKGCWPHLGGALSHGQPLPRYLFSIYWGQEKRGPAWMGHLQPLPPSCLASLPPPHLFWAAATPGARSTAEGPGAGRAEGRGGPGRGLGPGGAAQGSLLPTISDDGCK